MMVYSDRYQRSLLNIFNVESLQDLLFVYHGAGSMLQKTMGVMSRQQVTRKRTSSGFPHNDESASFEEKSSRLGPCYLCE